MTIKPLNDQILVKQAKAQEKSAGGLYIPTTAQEKTLEGEVLAVGNGRILENGERISPSVKAGDVVLFPKHSYTEIKIDDEDYLMIRDQNLLATINKND